MGTVASKMRWISAALIVVLTASLGVLSGRTSTFDAHRGAHDGVHQTAGAITTHPAEHRVPTIDGAINPSSIDDDVARVLFLRMAAHPDPVARDAYIRYMFGSDRPISAAQTQLVNVIAHYAESLKSLDQPSLGGADPASHGVRRRAILDQFRQEFGAALGQGGVARFDKVINERVKPRVRVFRRP